MKNLWEKFTDWLRRRVLGVALSFAAFIAMVSLVSPAWLDFIFDLSMVGVIAIVARLAKRS